MKITICAGFTLLEAMVTIAILAILLSVGVPNFSKARQSLSLSAAVSQFYFLLQSARNHALRHQTDITVVFSQAPQWWAGITTAADCQCSVSQRCEIAGVAHCINASDFPGIELNALTFHQRKVKIDGVRGLAVGSGGSVIISDGQRAAKIILSKLGRVRICMQTGQLARYKKC